MQIIRHVAAFAFLAQFSQIGVSANYEDGKASQINFYTDEVCTQYDGETAAWWDYHPTGPYAGDLDTGSKPQCFAIQFPAGTVSLNLAGQWHRNGNGYDLGFEFSGCEFYSDTNCLDEATSSGPCLSATSPKGFSWKSAVCSGYGSS